MKVSIEQVAAICHEVNRAYVKAVEGKEVEPWHKAPQWQKDSSIDGVWDAVVEPDVTPEMMHEKWMDYKIANGWTYGEIKDEEKKTHPCLVPYDQLPEAQKVKDYLFAAIVKAATTYLDCDFGPKYAAGSQLIDKAVLKRMEEQLKKEIEMSVFNSSTMMWTEHG